MQALDTIRFDFDPVLSRFAVRYRPQGTIAHRLLPYLPVPEQSAKIQVFGADSLGYVQTKRGLKAEPVEVTEGRSYVTLALETHSAQEKLDPLEVQAGRKVGIDETQRALLAIKDRIVLSREYDVQTMLTAATLWPSGHDTTIAGGSEWDQAAVDPYPVIMSAIDTVRDAIGAKPNVMALGYATWKAIRDNVAILDRINHLNANAPQVKQVRPDLLAALFELNEVAIAESQIYTGGALADIWSDIAILAVRNDTPTTPRPTFGVTAAQQYGTLPDANGEQVPLYGVAGVDPVNRWAISVWYQELSVPAVIVPGAGAIIRNTSSAV